MNKRVCYLANAASIHVHRWVNYFADRGWEVHLITWHPLSQVADIHPSIKIYRVLCPPFSISLCGTVMETYRLVRRINPDIIHAHYVSHFGIVAALYSFLSGYRPIVLTAWGPYGLLRSKGTHRRLIKYALGRADAVNAPSDYLRSIMVEKLGAPESTTTVLAWGIDLDIFHTGYDAECNILKEELGIRKDSFVILSPRALAKNYRIANIVQAMLSIIAEYPKTTLVLCRGSSNDHKYIDYVKNTIEKHQLQQNVYLIDQEVGPSRMAVLYNMADAFISIPVIDQFASCIMEGMACKVVPIVGNLEVYHQYLTDAENAFFVDPEKPGQIAKSIIHCIEHPEVKAKFGEINKTIIEEKEDWNKNAPKMEALYLELIEKARKQKGDMP